MRIADLISIIFILALLIAIFLVLNPNLFLGPKSIIDLSSKPGNAPELSGIHGYINSEEGLSISENIGEKVILIDFWTYTCINCIRTLPYITSWDEKYSDDGLLIIGVHTPEFDFEKEYANVLSAVKENNINYPVVLDNDYKTWNAYKNHYWPSKYLIDKNGEIVYAHFGEGAYAETELKIQELLEDLKESEITEEITSIQDPDPVNYLGIGTPELYFGDNFRRSPIGNQPVSMVKGGVYNFIAFDTILPNTIYLNGTWQNNADDFELISETGQILLFYKAKKVNIVAGADHESEIIVSLDQSEHKTLKINDFDLYNIVEGPDYSNHFIQINVAGSGFKISTFTFG